MEAVAADAEWVETFKTISKEEMNSPIKPNEIHPVDMAMYKRGGQLPNMEFTTILSERKKKIQEQRKIRMKRMKPLFATQPRLQMICRDFNNNFLDSGFTSYVFCDVTAMSLKRKEIDLKYLMNLCGYNLTELDLDDYHGGLFADDYPCDQIMPLIKSNCFNLKKLVLRFKEVESNNFDNVFSNMNHLEELSIYWLWVNSTLPMTLIKSLEHVRETLKTLVILCQPYRVSSVLSPETEALMTVISNMKNLEFATIKLDYGFTDELFINLTNNSKDLEFLKLCGSNITDKGLIAVNNLHQLKTFDLGLGETNSENKFITDQSIQCLFNKEMSSLDISNCTQVTNSSIIELVKNSPSLETLHIENTKATIELVEEISKLTKDRKVHLSVWVSFKINDNIMLHKRVIHPTLTFLSHIIPLKYTLQQ
ncbi:uncharacterized protein LOC122855236 [Aphidius gifuensis]|uniref:uncharacterized protein LOC122855236 n=1 Tax=Aphidius gifuensis TaxID=684658 RepID=UPI001CDC1751|nr:uncharacterized protein LOC122855236 [Aphidius gifuensis]